MRFLHKINEESEEPSTSSPDHISIVETSTSNVSFSSSIIGKWDWGNDIGLNKLPAEFDDDHEDDCNPFVDSEMDPSEIKSPCDSEISQVGVVREPGISSDCGKRERHIWFSNLIIIVSHSNY